jgi:hypothetical protein
MAGGGTSRQPGPSRRADARIRNRRHGCRRESRRGYGEGPRDRWFDRGGMRISFTAHRRVNPRNTSAVHAGANPWFRTTPSRSTSNSSGLYR